MVTDRHDTVSQEDPGGLMKRSCFKSGQSDET